MTKKTLSDAIHPFIFFLPSIDILFKCNISTNFIQVILLSWIILRNNCILNIIHEIDFERENFIDFDSIFFYRTNTIYDEIYSIISSITIYIILSKYYTKKKVFLIFFYMSTFFICRNCKRNDILSEMHIFLYKSPLRYLLLIPLIYLFHDYNKNYSNKILMNIYLFALYCLLKFSNIYYYKITYGFELEIVIFFYFIYINYYCKKDKKIKK